MSGAAPIVEVWMLRLPLPDGAEAELARVLTSDEVCQADAYVRPGSREKFVARRALLRHVLAARLDVHPRRVRFVRGRYGKPRLSRRTDLRFNVSDTEGLVAVALGAGREVGVDAEFLKPRRLVSLATGTFTRGELDEFMSAPARYRRAAFYEQWTSKEAYAKALGLGLRLPFRRVPVGRLSDTPAPLPRSSYAQGETWAGARLPAGEHHRAAIVAAGVGWRAETRTVDFLDGIPSPARTDSHTTGGPT
jgi:4'-phosphopantetheinyl transferase